MCYLIRNFLLSVGLLLAYTDSFGQLPTLKVTSERDSKPVVMESMKVDVQIHGSIAKTVMTLTFRNKSSRELEGELTFPMPEGVSVNRYAIDINGKLREAVPVEKAKATEVFESIEHRRVDPGLLEKVEGNNFRTRIYPLPAGGTRTVLIGYEEELFPDNKHQLQYRLPFDQNSIIPELHLKVIVFENLLKPVLEEQPDGSFSFENNGNTYVAELNKSNFKPNHSLVINLSKMEGETDAVAQSFGDGYYFMLSSYPKTQGRPRTLNNHIGLIWDVSLSGQYRDHKKEFELLDKLIAQQKSLTIDLGLLNNRFQSGGSFEIKNGNWTRLRNTLGKLIYDGGTNFSKIDEGVLTAEEYLLFSDGLSTFGKDTVQLNGPVHCITAATRADFSLMRAISNRSGGQFINLNNISAESGIRLLNEEPMMFLGIKQNAAVSNVYPSMPVVVNGYVSVAGVLQKGTDIITLLFGYGGKVTTEKQVRLKMTPSDNIAMNVSRLWAQKRIAELELQYEQNKKQIGELGKQYGIVTKNTSLLVLEAVEDYVRYDINPPAELQEQYALLRKQKTVEKQERMNDLLQRAFEMTANLKQWYTEKRSPVQFKRMDRSQGTSVEDRFDGSGMQGHAAQVASEAEEKSGTIQANQISAERPQPPLRPTVHFTPPVFKANEEVRTDTVVTNAYTTSSTAADETYKWNKGGAVTIKVPDFKTDKDYIKPFNNARKESAYQIYLRLRPEYATTPLFYYDVASWFYQHQDKDTALMILSSIADLELENAELYKLLSYKLKEVGQYEAEVFTTAKVLQWRPMDPQSYRDYALALQDAGWYQKSLDTMYSALVQSYTLEAAERDQGIEEILITEINNLIAVHGNKLNLRRIDKQLLQQIPVDVRVVINWNKNETDIDLWVTDPRGEKCFYSNPNTAAGGRISNDFTAGFGPEQFMLKKALKGKYKIEVNYYGDHQLSITGPTTVMAEIYTRYSTGVQQRKIINLQMPGDSREGVMIGSFSF